MLFHYSQVLIVLNFSPASLILCARCQAMINLISLKIPEIFIQNVTFSRKLHTREPPVTDWVGFSILLPFQAVQLSGGGSEEPGSATRKELIKLADVLIKISEGPVGNCYVFWYVMLPISWIWQTLWFDLRVFRLQAESFCSCSDLT